MQSVKGPQRTTIPPSGDDSTPAAQEAPASHVPYAAGSDVFDVVWRFFCSTRLALIIILLIAAGSLVGALLQQAPAGITADPVAYDQWLLGLRPRFGMWTDVLRTIQFFDVFNSLWFRLLLATLTISTVICTVNRWNGIWRSIAKPRLRMGDGYFRKASHSVVVSANGKGVDATADVVTQALVSQRYRVLTEQDNGRVYLYADRNRFGKLGTFLNHLSLVLILAGAIFGGMFGFRDRGFTVPVGSERPVGFGTNMTLRVDSFIDEYYPEGPPKDYRTDAVLLDNDVEVKRHTIRVNDPLEYQGVRFYQSFFGPAAVIEAKDEAGNVLFSDGVAMAWRSKDERPVGVFSLPQEGLEVYLVGPWSGRADSLIPAGQIRLEIYRAGTRVPEIMDNLVTGRPKKLGNLEYTFVRELQFTGLQVAKDPGTSVIWLASALMVVGLAMVFYFPHRRIWIVCRPDREDKRTEVVLGATARRDMGFDEEFRRVVGSVKAHTAASN